MTIDQLLSITSIATYVLYIVIAILLLMLMITIHEFGHYSLGKLLKFKVDEFAIGFGKAIYTHKAKNGEIFSVRLVPLGGYCAFSGEDSLEENNDDKNLNIESTNETNAKIKERAKSFNEQAPWKKIIVLLGGVLFNFLSAIIFSFILLVGFGYDIPEVKSVETDGINAHLRQGDVITYVENKKIDYTAGTTFADLLTEFEGDTLQITILRDGEELQTELNRETREVDGQKYKYYDLSIGPHPQSFGQSLSRSVPLTFAFGGKIFEFLGQLFTGQVALSTVTGPVTTITTIATYSQQSIANLFVFLPFISVNLAIFNILPIPALDGSKIVFTIIEWIRGRPINRKVENYIHTIGLFVLLAFVVFVDLFHFFT